MTIIEKMLSLTNQSDMGAIIEHYTDETYRNINMTAHLHEWAVNKQHIFELFGNQLKIEMPVETQLPYTMVIDKLKMFLETEFSLPKYNLIKVFLRAISPDEIGNNILSQDFTMFDTVFKRGIKVSRCFKFLTKKEWLDEANIKYSMFLQSLKAKGTAVLSIDPNDFLTMSANNSGWRSCHAPDGEYRAGQIAYMMDESSVISYVKSSEDCLLPNGTVHANKIWRQIVLINNTNTYALQCRQYPATNDANALTVGKMLMKAFEKHNNGRQYNCHKAEVCEKYYFGLQQSHSYDALYYNDIANGAFDEGYIVLPLDIEPTELVDKLNSEEYPQIIVGKDVPCLDGCGTLLDNPEYYFHENNGCYDYDYDSYDYSDED